MDNSEFKTYSHGKLLITGEYLVLRGATVLAIPIKLGQSFRVKKITTPVLAWRSTHASGKWFSASFDENFTMIESSDEFMANKLKEILIVAVDMANIPFEDLLYKQIKTHLEFNPQWGLGSSSTLINNIAQWLQIDAYELLEKTFGGSGYDMACARREYPIHYANDQQLLSIAKASFNPPFAKNIYFVYSGKKVKSSDAIENFRQRNTNASDIKTTNQFTQQFTHETNLKDFMKLMDEHEAFVSNLIDLQTVKKTHFTDFKGSIKSLGAWGGDFMMIATSENEDYVRSYFKQKECPTLFKYNELILDETPMQKDLHKGG